MRAEPTGFSWLHLGRPRVAGSAGGLVQPLRAAEALYVGQEVELLEDFTVQPLASGESIGVVVGGKATQYTAMDEAWAVGMLAANAGQNALVCIVGIAYIGTSSVDAVRSVLHASKMALPYYPVVTGEVGVVAPQYPHGHLQRHGGAFDGVTLNDTAFADAAASAAALGVDVVLPEGLGLFAQSLRPEYDNLTVRGSGATRIQVTNDVCAVLTQKNPGEPDPVTGIAPLDAVHNLTLRDFVIDCTNGRGPDSGGHVQLNNAENFRVANVDIRGAGSALQDGFAFSQGSYGTVSVCTADGTNKTGFYTSYEAGKIVFLACRSMNNQGDTGGVGFSLFAPADLHGCSTNNTKGHAVNIATIGPEPLYASRQVRIFGGEFLNSTAGAGVYVASIDLAAQPTDVLVSGAVIMGHAAGPGVLAECGKRLRFQSCTIANNGYDGVEAQANVNGLAVIDCDIRNNGAAITTAGAVRISGAQDVQLRGGTWEDDQDVATQGFALLLDIGAGGEQPGRVQLGGVDMSGSPGTIGVLGAIDFTAARFEWEEPTLADPETNRIAPMGARVYCSAADRWFRKTTSSGATGWITEDLVGSGSPEGVVNARVGSRYFRLDGGASTTLYVKESGTGNSGWVAK